jgi:DnaJ-domain-containing protein 1
MLWISAKSSSTGSDFGRDENRALLFSHFGPGQLRCFKPQFPDGLLGSKAMSTHYETLGIPKSANANEIKNSYHSLVKIYHPDRFAEGSKAHAQAEKRIREINAAYAVLSKPRSRASYDLTLNRALPHSGADPEYCANCGRPTTYWHRSGKSALCHVCAASNSKTMARGR